MCVHTGGKHLEDSARNASSFVSKSRNNCSSFMAMTNWCAGVGKSQQKSSMCESFMAVIIFSKDNS